MKIKPYIEKLEKSSEFKQFRTEYPNAFMAAGFFVIDLESGMNVHQIDFYIPSKRKFAAFTLDEKVQLQIVDALSEKTPEKLGLDTNIDLDALKGILTDEMHNRGMAEEIRKMIAVIQNLEGKRIWNVNCVLSGMEILRSHVDDETQTVLKIEKDSITDIMKKIPMQQLQKQQNISGEDAKKEIEKLNKIEEEIEKEKKRLEKSIKKEGENGNKLKGKKVKG